VTPAARAPLPMRCAVPWLSCAAMDLAKLLRDVPDFPKPGILFKDITPLLASPAAMRETIARFAALDVGRVDKVAAIESRGFLFGAPLAMELGVGFVPIRKPGKLPWKTNRVEYVLEYGTDAVEIHQDAVQRGERVLVVDDLLATGGTMGAACKLVEACGGAVAACLFVVELAFLSGRPRLGDRRIEALITVR
jgi:adenine phosphoribosyltransferase